MTSEPVLSQLEPWESERLKVTRVKASPYLGHLQAEQLAVCCTVGPSSFVMLATHSYLW